MRRPRAVRIGPKGWPKKTLGWAAMDWACRYLRQPDGPGAGSPWEFTEEQARFVAWWYAIDEAGRLVYRNGVLRRMKGWGKDPLGAVLCAIEFVGPCRFGGWSGKEPIVVPQQSAWVQTAAVSKEQTRNTMVLFPSLFSDAAMAEYSLDIGKEIIYAHKGRAQIQSVTSSPKTLEGARSTFVLMNETHLWLQNNEGLDMEAAINRNTAKVSGRSLQITNAHRIGEGSTAERAWEAWQKGAVDALYDSLEAPEDTDYASDKSVLAGLIAARGDSVWVPVERLLAEIRDPRTSEGMGRRFYLNQIRPEHNSWVSAAEWKGAERDEDVPEGTLITLGFDGSRFRDATALVGTVVETGYQFVIGLWERPGFVDDWEVPVEEVNMAVAEAFERYDVWRMYCDPRWWETRVAKWAGRYGDHRVVEWPTNRPRQMAYSLLAYRNAITEGQLFNDGNPVMTQHIANAVRHRENFYDERGNAMVTIRKERQDSPRKIDAVMAGCLSDEARRDALTSGAQPHSDWVVV